MASKKRKTFTASSRESKENYVSAYTLPETFVYFLDELEEACEDGDNNLAIERLAPQMAAILKDNKQWENPSVPLHS